MDLKNKELVCDEIFSEQPNLLGSVLVMKKMGNTLKDVDVLLNILIVLHLALKESGVKIAEISEQEQDRELKLLTSVITFSEGMGSRLVDSSINQFISDQKYPFLLTYVIDTMKDAGFYVNQNEISKYLIMAGVNLVACISHAVN